ATEVDLQNSQTAIPVELNGPVSSLSGTASAFQFMVNGTLVKGDSTTVLTGDDTAATFADLKNGVHVEVKGAQQTGFVQASRIRIDRPVVTTVEVEGVVSSLSGTAAAFQFMVNSTLVKGDTTTTLAGDDKPATFADLKNGVRVEVKGTQQTGFVQ